jgi:hypothetical protein
MWPVVSDYLLELGLDGGQPLYRFWLDRAGEGWVAREPHQTPLSSSAT